MKLTAKQKQNFNGRLRRYRDHPDGRIMFAKEVMNLTPEAEQEIALRLHQSHPRVAIKSGHGVGKTVTNVILMFAWLFCYPNSLVVCSAPSLHQLNDQLWREAGLWLRKSIPALRYFLNWTPTKIFAGGSKEWYAVATPSSSPHNLAGFHNPNLLMILDEAPGIKESAFEVIEGALTQENNRLAMIGNPTRVGGYYYKAFKDPGDLWGLATFNSENSKNVTPGYAGKMEKMYGRNSNAYKVRVLGEFPTGEDDSILTIDLIINAQNRDEPEQKLSLVHGGCDVARYGDDKTEIYIRKGFEIIDHAQINYSDLVQVQSAILHLIRKHSVTCFKIDQTGMGGGVVDNLADLIDSDPDIDCEIIGIDNNQLAQDQDEYENAGSEMYFNLREILLHAKIPEDDELFADLVLRKYKFSRLGRFIIESKEELRAVQKRQGLKLRSPDKGDALALCFYNVESNSSFLGGGQDAY